MSFALFFKQSELLRVQRPLVLPLAQVSPGVKKCRHFQSSKISATSPPCCWSGGRKCFTVLSGDAGCQLFDIFGGKCLPGRLLYIHTYVYTTVDIVFVHVLVGVERGRQVSGT